MWHEVNSIYTKNAVSFIGNIFYDFQEGIVIILAQIDVSDCIQKFDFNLYVNLIEEKEEEYK